MSTLRRILERAEVKRQRAAERKRAKQIAARGSSLFRIEAMESRLLLSADVTPLPSPTDLQNNTAAVVSMTDLPTALDVTLVEANHLHIAPELRAEAEALPPEPATGVAVQVNIPRDLRPDATGKVTAKINISDAKDLESADIVFSYNPNDFLDLTEPNIRLGTVMTGGTLVVNLNAAGSTATNRIVTLAAAVTTPRGTGPGSLIEIDFTVRNLASTNNKPVNLRSVSLNEDGIPVNPPPTIGDDVATDGLVLGATGPTNPAPTDILLSNTSVAENQAVGTVVGNLSAVDDAGDAATFALVAGTGSTDNGSFQIVGSQLRTNESFNFEVKNSYSIRVQVSDGANQTFQKVFSVNVTNVNEQPTDIALSNNSVAENSAVGTAVGNFSASDPDVSDTHTFTLVAGTGSTDNASFQIVGNQLRTNAVLDFESKNSFSVRVRATDSGTGNLTFEKIFTVNVTDVVETVPNQPPTDIVLSNNSVAENQAVGTAVGNLTATDPDTGDTHTFTLVAGTGNTDNASFQIVGNQLRTNAVFDFETKNSFSVRVRATDSGTGNLTFEKVFTVNVTNVNEQPTDIALSNNSVAENSAVGSAVGNFSATDPDAGDTQTFTLVAGTGNTDNASFQIVGNQLRTNAVFDFETKNSFSVRVRATDSGTGNLTFEKVFTVNVTNVNEQPTDIALSNNSVAENSAVGSAVGNFSATDPDAGDTHTFTLVAGTGSTDNASFQIVGNQLRTNAVFDFETKNSFSVRVRATDSGTGNLTFEKIFTVNVTDVVETVPNQPPTDIVLSNNSVAENQAVGTAVGNLTATDPDTGDTHTFTLVAGTGSTDNASFQIVGNQLRTNAVFDFETKNSFSVRVRATDSGTGNLTFEKVFTVNVTNVNEQPTDIALSNNSVAENSAVGSAVGNFSATDPDAGDTQTFTLVAGTGSNDNASFQIVGNQLRTNASLDFESKNSYSIRVRATDAGGQSFEKVFTVNVTNVNEQPTDIALSNNSVAENQPVGTPVGNLSASDPDSGDTQIFTLVAGTGSTDNASFQIVGNQLRTNAVFDFETKNSFSIRVRVADAGGLSFEKILTVNVTDVNETDPNQQPTDIALSNNSVAENQAAGTAVGNLTATDPDVGDAHTFTLVAGTGSTDNGSFQIVGSQLRTNASFDFEAKSSFSVRVRATDVGGLSFEKVFTVNVTNVNEQPTDIALSNNSVAENQAAGTPVGNFSASDPDAGDTQTFSLVGGTGSTDNASFQIVGNQLRTNASFDFETKNSFSIRVRATDVSGLSFEKVFTVNVTNVNEQPTDIALSNNSVAENQAAGTAVGNLSATDPDAGDTQTFTLVAGTGSTDNASFQIVGNQLRTNAVFDFETKNSYSIRVRTTDAGGLSFEKVFTVNVTDVNETIPNQQPTDIALSNNSVAENQAVGTAVGNLSATDPDTGDTHTFALVAGTGSTDNASFQIVGNQLRTNASFNFEVKNSFSIRVRATDSGTGNLTFEKVFTVNVTNVNESPSVTAATFNVAENSANGTAVGTVAANDPDAGQTLSFSITGGNTNGAFAINSNTGVITVANSAALNFETTPQFLLTVQATDNGTPTLNGSNTITVNLINQTNTSQLVTAGGAVNFSAPAGVEIGVSAVTPIPPGAPAGATFPVGLFTFTLSGLAAGGSANVDITLPAGVVATSFLKFGPEAGNTTSHYYEYLFNGTTGAEILNGGNLIRLHLVDGGRGDFDLSANGTITDPGAPVLLAIIDHPPVANNDSRNSFNLKEDTALIVAASRGVLSNDTDADGDILTAKLAGASSGGQSANGGQVVLNANGSFTYTPRANFFGTDTFTYVANDGSSDSNVATVTVVVTPVNDAPVANTDNYTVSNPTVLFTRNAAQGVLSNDSDADNNSLTAQLVSGPQLASSFTLNPDGSFSYRVDLEDIDSNNVIDSFTYKANDGTISGNTATVFLNIQSLATAPRLASLSALGAGPEVAKPIIPDEPTIVGEDTESVPFLTNDTSVQSAEVAPVTNSLANSNNGLVLDPEMSASLTQGTGKEWLFFTTIG